MKELELSIKGMECTGCENRIKNSFSELKEVKRVSASYKNGKVNIVFKKNVPEDIKNTIITKIENLGFEAEK